MRAIRTMVTPFIFFCSLVTHVVAEDFKAVKDLESDWKLYENGRFMPFEEHEGDIHAIYFLLEASKYPGTILSIRNAVPFALFVNGQVISNHNAALQLSVDSLMQIYQTDVLQISIYQEKVYGGGLKTTIQSSVQLGQVTDPAGLLRFSSFRDFAIVGMLILMVMIIVIVQLNPKLAADYFSMAKIFSMREGDDSQAYSRIASSINILFYAYCSLMLGYYLMLVFHFLPLQYTVARAFQGDTFWDAIIQWLELSLLIMGLFFLKILLIYSLSFVFGISEIAGIHFFNWVRLLLGVFGVLTIALFLYFVLHGQQERIYIFLLTVLSWVLISWTILIILKLRRQLSHTMFHLFSYICATELIPFLITIKVLYY